MTTKSLLKRLQKIEQREAEQARLTKQLKSDLISEMDTRELMMMYSALLRSMRPPNPIARQQVSKELERLPREEIAKKYYELSNKYR